MTYILNNRGCEYLGGEPGESVTVQEVQDVWGDIMGENTDDIVVRSTGLWLLREGLENILLASPEEVRDE